MCIAANAVWKVRKRAIFFPIVLCIFPIRSLLEWITAFWMLLAVRICTKHMQKWIRDIVCRLLDDLSATNIAWPRLTYRPTSFPRIVCTCIQSDNPIIPGGRNHSLKKRKMWECLTIVKYTYLFLFLLSSFSFLCWQATEWLTDSPNGIRFLLTIIPFREYIGVCSCVSHRISHIHPSIYSLAVHAAPTRILPPLNHLYSDGCKFSIFLLLSVVAVAATMARRNIVWLPVYIYEFRSCCWQINNDTHTKEEEKASEEKICSEYTRGIHIWILEYLYTYTRICVCVHVCHDKDGVWFHIVELRPITHGIDRDMSSIVLSKVFWREWKKGLLQIVLTAFSYILFINIGNPLCNCKISMKINVEDEKKENKAIRNNAKCVVCAR